MGKTSVSFIPPIIKNNNIFTTNLEKVDLFSNYFADIFSIDDSNAQLPLMPATAGPYLDNIVCTPQEITKIISSIPNGKACGPDGITVRMLKLSSHFISDNLAEIFNYSLRSGKYPKNFKQANVTPLLKKGEKLDKHSMENYRGISLLSIVSKILERIVFIKLYDYLSSKGFFARCQSGYIKGDSTTNRLLQMTHEIYKSFSQGKDVIGCFLDISKAFDKVWHRGLLYKLEKAGIRGSLLKWFESYLLNREIRVVIEGCNSDWKEISAGVPQGSILGPILFLIYINDICDDIDTPICR